MDTSRGERQRLKEFCNKQFYQAVNSKARLRIFQGGTRSGKSWSLMQYCLYLMTTETEPLTISIVRKTLPALKRSVLRDFQHIAKGLGIYFAGVHNKTDNTFEYNGHLLEMFSTDDPQKIRGSARDILWMNEGNECFEEDFRQLALRTRKYILIDFNPSDPIHYLYDLAERDDADLFISTYKDNKFLPKETVDEIERVTSIAIDFAKKRRNKITLVDKANVLETSRLWRKTVQEISLKHPEVELDYMFVDNAAMQIILNPKQFDVILTENLFGDIISDEASVIGGSIGILSSASIGGSMGLFEPIHGSFPQATNKNIANPVAAILSASMMLNYLNLGNGAKMIEKAVENSLINKVSTADINNISPAKTSQVGDYISNFIKENN